MAHYRMQDRLPSAIVTAGGSEKKVYEGNSVFFNKGDNFELRFFNPLQEKIGVEIIFNGQKKNDGFLVLKPGEDVSLDRFLGDKNKMVFDTYDIDANNPTAVKAAALNGIIDIKFHKEKFTNNWNSGTFMTANSVNYNTRLYTGGYNPPGTFTTEFDNSNSTLTSNISSTPDSLGVYAMNSLSLNESKSIETGRVEKGDVSEQKLNVVDMEFESVAFHTIQYNLKPLSTMSHTTEIRNYCPNCQYRLRKSSWNYCPKCSEKL